MANNGLTAALYEKPVIIRVVLAAPGVQRMPDLPGCRRLTWFPHKAPRTPNLGRVWVMVRSGQFDPALASQPGQNGFGPTAFADPVAGSSGMLLDTYDINAHPAYPYALQWWSPESASANFNLSDYWIQTEVADDGIEVSITY